MLSAYPHGHGFFYGIKDVKAPRNDYSISPITPSTSRNAAAPREADGRSRGVCPVLGTVFPNMSFHANSHAHSGFASRGPNLTEMWRVYFVDKEAPQEARDFLRRYYMRYSGPGGMTEQDDMENWSYASQASEGLIARRYPITTSPASIPAPGIPSFPGLSPMSPLPANRIRACCIAAGRNTWMRRAGTSCRIRK